MWGNPKCAITPGQLEIIAKVVRNSVSTYKERRDRGRKYYIALVQSQINAGKRVSKHEIEEMNKLESEIEAEQRGGRTELRG